MLAGKRLIDDLKAEERFMWTQSHPDGGEMGEGQRRAVRSRWRFVLAYNDSRPTLAFRRVPTRPISR